MTFGPIGLERDGLARRIDARFEKRSSLGFRRVVAEPVSRPGELPRRIERRRLLLELGGPGVGGATRAGQVGPVCIEGVRCLSVKTYTKNRDIE